MKLVYSVIVFLWALKWAAAKPLNTSSSYNISAAADKLVAYYNEEYNFLAEEICFKLKNIADEIQKDVVVQSSATPLMLELKKNLTEFQQCYPYFKRVGFNATLMFEFSDLIKGFYYPSPYANNTDFIYIQQLLKKLGYNEIRDTLRNKFKTFLENKFLIKFAELQADLNNKSQNTLVLKWISFLKECQDYECYLNDFQSYKRLHGGLLDYIFGEMFHGLFKSMVINAANTTAFAQAMLRDPKLLQLSAPIKQQLTRNLQDIIKVQENFNEFAEILFFHPISYLLLYRFEDYASISLRDRLLINRMFNDHDYKSLHFGANEVELEKSDYLKQHEDRIATLSSKQLAVLKNISEGIERLVKASNPQERTEIFKSLAMLLNEKPIML